MNQSGLNRSSDGNEKLAREGTSLGGRGCRRCNMYIGDHAVLHPLSKRR